jgi:hypothetical protein
MKSIVWCINIVIILFCSIAYADQRTVVSFDDLPLLPLLTETNQLRLANNDNPDYKGIWFNYLCYIYPFVVITEFRYYDGEL